MAWPCALGLLLTRLLLTESARGVKFSQILPCLLRERGARPPAMVASAFSEQLHTNENQRLRGLAAKQIREESQTNLRKNDLLRAKLCDSLCLCGEIAGKGSPPQRHRGPQRSHREIRIAEVLNHDEAARSSVRNEMFMAPSRNKIPEPIYGRQNMSLLRS